MRADPVRAARVHRRRTALACLGTVIVVAVAVAAVMVLRDNGSPAANGQPAVAHGGSFPDVTVEDADGVTITTSSLTGKPTLVWFSDSTCPDVDGLHRVASLDDETGGQGLQILMVFLDQRVSSSTLGAWRGAFGRPDWLIAADRDGALSAAARVRMPETKILLDERATIVDQTTRLVDDAYLSLLRQRAHT